MSNPVMHWQMISANPDRIAQFYGELFDWKISVANGMGYRMIEAEQGNGIGGGIWPSQPEGSEITQIYIEVRDIDDVLRRIQTLGGKILVSKQLLPDGDAMALATDPLGRPFGLMTSKAHS
jgi:uncharacterized protein